MSEHSVKVVRVKNVRPHPNADRLELANIDGYQVVIGKGAFKTGDLGAYIEPDYEVPVTRPAFEFLWTDKRPDWHRTKVIKLRGATSEGLLIPAPPGAAEGDDVMGRLGVRKWEPPMDRDRNGKSMGMRGECVKAPVACPVYDVEALKKFPDALVGVPVAVTVKYHGTNARYVWAKGRLHAGSRNTWKRPPAKQHWGLPFVRRMAKLTGWTCLSKLLPKLAEKKECIWWQAVRQNPYILAWCKVHPGQVLYGEVVGRLVQGQGWEYGEIPGVVGFKAFDAYDPETREFWEYSRMRASTRFFGVQELAVEVGGFSPACADRYYDMGPGGQLREGIVVRSLAGHKLFKCINPAYLERS